MHLNVDPGFDADLEVAQRALERGWVTREGIESAILQQERTPGSRLVNLLPLTPDQLQRLLAPESPMPPEIAKVAQEPSRRFDHYILGDFLHSGGMGRVYKAWDLKLSRWVALKCLKAVGDERSEAYFDREARLAAGLSHPNIAAIYASGRVGGECFIAMQLIPGKTLDQWGRRDVPRLVTWIRDAARAVAYANSKGIVHRDLKPTNVMVTPEGQVFVLDFGLARPVALDKSHSATGKAMGTPAYMSPEQARGEAVDARSDVYSLGATLFECLTGRAPFSGTTIYDVLRKVEEAAPARPRRLNPRIAPDLETIILKCLEKDAARRYRSADELADDLDRYLNHDPIQARPAGVFYRMRRNVAKRKAIAIASIASVVLAGVLGWWFLVGRPHSEHLSVESEHLRLRESAMKLWAEVRGLAMAGVDAHAVPPKARSAREAFERAIAVREEAGAHLMRGKCLQLEGQLDASLQALDRAYQLEPENAEARIELAKILSVKYQVSRGYPQEGILSKGKGREIEVTPGVLQGETPAQKGWRERAEKLLALGSPVSPQSDLMRGLLELGGGEYARAASAIAVYTKVESWDAQALVLEGTCLHYAGDYAGAIAAFDKSLVRQPNHSTVWRRGKAFMNAGQHDKAIADFTRAIETEPRQYEYHHSRGLCLSLKGDFEAAIADLSRAIEMKPDDALARNNRGCAYSEKGRSAEAMADFTKAIELNPAYAKAYSNRGSEAFSQGRSDDAIADLKKSLELSPANPNAWLNLGNARFKKGLIAESIDDFTRAIELEPNDSRFYNNRGWSKVNLARWDEALSDFVKAIELNPLKPEAWANRALTRFTLGMKTEAVEDWKKALELAPPHWGPAAGIRTRLANLEEEFLYQEGMRLIETGKFAEAADSFKKFVESYPSSRRAISAAYNAACGYALKGRRESALEWLEKAVDLGWSDVAYLEKDKDLDSLRGDERYRRLVARLKGE